MGQRNFVAGHPMLPGGNCIQEHKVHPFDWLEKREYERGWIFSEESHLPKFHWMTYRPHVKKFLPPGPEEGDRGGRDRRREGPAAGNSQFFLRSDKLSLLLARCAKAKLSLIAA